MYLRPCQSRHVKSRRNGEGVREKKCRDFGKNALNTTMYSLSFSFKIAFLKASRSRNSKIFTSGTFFSRVVDKFLLNYSKKGIILFSKWLHRRYLTGFYIHFCFLLGINSITFQIVI